MNNQQLEFLPFHAINEFMRPDFRQAIVSEVLLQQSTLAEPSRNAITRLTKKYVKLPGFRNSASAPATVRIKPTITAFEKNPEVTAAIIACWAELHTPLRQQVYDFLKAKNWDVLPPEADRTKLPGFLTTWPEGEDFDILNADFQTAYPDGDSNADHVSLMAVWLSGRLPYNQASSEEGQA